MELFIDRLEKVLEKKGITKAELAEKTGIRRPTLSEWKKNGAIPAGDVCVRIARYLDVDVEWLITGKEREEAQQAPQARNELLEDFASLTREQQEHILISIGVFQAQNGGRGKKTGA